MNWNTVFKPPEFPAQGQERCRIVFAWFPVECKNGKTYWLEKIKIIEIFNGVKWFTLRYKPLKKDKK